MLHVLMHFLCPCRNTKRNAHVRALPSANRNAYVPTLPNANRNAHALLNANSGLVRLIPVRETSKSTNYAFLDWNQKIKVMVTMIAKRTTVPLQLMLQPSHTFGRKKAPVQPVQPLQLQLLSHSTIRRPFLLW